MSNKIVPRPKDFVWAFEKSANLREPFEEVKKQGWRFGDAPMAANFNYLFNEVGRWHEYLEFRINALQDDLFKNYEEDERIRKDLKDVVTVLKAVTSILQERYPGLYLPKLPEH